MKFELEPDNRGQPDDVLLEDLRAIAAKLGVKTLTQSKYDEHGRFSAATLKKRFGRWNLALAAASLSPAKLMNVPSELLIGDITRVARLLNTTQISREQYEERGKYSASPIERRFGSWNKAIAIAGFEPLSVQNISIDELFDNIERVWRHLGRQPTIDEMRKPLSRYSGATYKNRFGGYRKALEAFVAAIGDESQAESGGTKDDVNEAASTPRVCQRRKTSRTIGWRLRFLTFRRDGYRCRACGRSPAKELGVELEVDHIVPWSDGGETILENLQLLCRKCNGGKSNLDWEEQR